MLEVEKKREIVLDESYPYLQKGFGYQLLRIFYWLCINLVVFPFLRVYYGLRIDGQENLKKHKKALKNGAITISNHVFMMDFLCVLRGKRIWRVEIKVLSVCRAAFPFQRAICAR